MKLKTLAIALLLALPALAQDDPYAALKAGDWQNRTGFAAVLKLISEAGGERAKLDPIEDRLAALLGDPACGEAAKLQVCRLLWMIGTGRCVPATAKLLADPKLADTAAWALERNPSAEAGKALRDALATSAGTIRLGLINILGERRDGLAVGTLKALTSGETAEAAIAALGKIGTPEAVAALQALPPTAVTGRALTTAARALLAEGQKDAAQAVYRVLAAADKPSEIRVAGLRGLAASGAADAIEQALAAAGADDARVSRAAGYLLVDLPEAAIARYVAAFDQLPAPTRAAVLAALADRGATQAADTALAALTSDDGLIRKAAIAAAARLGGARAVEALGRLAVSGNGDARFALARMSGEGVNEAVVRLAGEGDKPLRLEMIKLLAERNMVSAVGRLTELTGDADAQIASEAWRAVSRLATVEQFAALVGRLVATGHGGIRNTGTTALVALARRLGRPAAQPPLLAALPGANTEGKLAVLAILAELGGPEALQALTEAARGADADLRAGAVDLLADVWTEASGLPLLSELARTAAEAEVKTAALRGALRLLGEARGIEPAERVARLKALLGENPRTSQIKQALSVLRNCRCVEAVELAAGWLDKEDVYNEAAGTILHLASAQKVDNRDVPAVTGPAVEQAVRRVREKRGEALPAGWFAQDIGSVGLAGETLYQAPAFQMTGSGSDFWGVADAGQFAYRRVTGDVSITARVVSLEPVDGWSKAGVMIRQSLDAGSPEVMMCVTPGNTCSFQHRPSQGAESLHQTSGQGEKAPYWVRLERVGEKITGSISADGQTWRKIGEVTVPLTGEILVGLGLTSHNNGKLTKAVFDNVATIP